MGSSDPEFESIVPAGIRSRGPWLGLAAAVALLLTAGCGEEREPHDLILSGGRVVDGTGSAARVADVAVKDGRIAAVGEVDTAGADRVIDASGLVVAPGFIDMMGQTSLPLITDPPSAKSKLRQGITTMLTGEGGSPAPQDDRTASGLEEEIDRPVSWRSYEEYFSLLEKEGLPLNVAHNVGATQVRRIVLGDEDVQPDSAQMQRMKRLVDESMQAGAVGLSTALIYPPATYASTDELVELARIAGRYGGTYFTHMRNEGNRVLEAIREAVEIGRRAEVPVHIFHLKAAGRDNWPLMEEALDLIRDAREEGIEVTADVYPYLRNGIGLGSFIHPRHYREGEEALRERLSDPAFRRQLREEIETTYDWENWYRHVGEDWGQVLISSVGDEGDPRRVGRTIREVAEARGVSAWTAFFDLVEQGGVSVNPKSMNERQKELAMQAPFVCFDTDYWPVNPDRVEGAHPRAFGAFPRVLGKYVREREVISLPEAVHKLASLPASILGLEDRGTIEAGKRADLVAFDPGTVRDRATFTDPLRYPVGIPYVVVNGAVAIDDGVWTEARPGTVVRGGSSAGTSGAAGGED